MDRMLPPLVFMVSFLAMFVALSLAFAPTIHQNQQSTAWSGPNPTNTPDWMVMFSSANYTFLSPNPASINGSKLVTSYPLLSASARYRFTTPQEANHPVDAFCIKSTLTDLGVLGPTPERHEFAFQQQGGWLGTQTWGDSLRFDSDFAPQRSQTTNMIIAYVGTIHLRHDYTVILSGNETQDLKAQVMSWHFSMSIAMITDTSIHSDPWTIIGQLFTFSLPGVDPWIQAMIMAPVGITIGVCAYVLIRSVLPW